MKVMCTRAISIKTVGLNWLVPQNSSNSVLKNLAMLR